MIIRANDMEIMVDNVFSENVSINGRRYPALRFVMGNNVTQYELDALASGHLEMLDGRREVVGVHDGYTTRQDVTFVIAKVKTVEQERDDLEAALAVQTAKIPLVAKVVEKLDDATASEVVELYPSMEYSGKLIKAGTRIQWGGKLKRAAVDLWDTVENDPRHAPDLWEDINYRAGYREIPDVITAGLAFAQGECGWRGDTLYRSLIPANVYTPEQYPAGWEIVNTEAE